MSDTELCPKRRPLRPQHPIFTVIRRGGLHFGHHTSLRSSFTTTKRGGIAPLGARRGEASAAKLPLLLAWKVPKSPRLSDQAEVPVGGERAWPRRRRAMAGLTQTNFAHNLRR